MGKTLDEAIAFARKHGMKVEEMSPHRYILKVTYPSGEFREIHRDDPSAAQQIVDMTCNLL